VEDPAEIVETSDNTYVYNREEIVMSIFLALSKTAIVR
jgi:hypothetical protein